MDISKAACLTQIRENIRQLSEIHRLAKELLESDTLTEQEIDGSEIETGKMEERHRKNVVAVHSNMKEIINTRDRISDLEVLSKRLKKNG